MAKAKDTAESGLAGMSDEELGEESVRLAGQKEEEGRTPAIRESQLAVQQEINKRGAKTKLADALAGLDEETKTALLSEVSSNG